MVPQNRQHPPPFRRDGLQQGQGVLQLAIGQVVAEQEEEQVGLGIEAAGRIGANRQELLRNRPPWPAGAAGEAAGGGSNRGPSGGRLPAEQAPQVRQGGGAAHHARIGPDHHPRKEVTAADDHQPPGLQRCRQLLEPLARLLPLQLQHYNSAPYGSQFPLNSCGRAKRQQGICQREPTEKRPAIAAGILAGLCSHLQPHGRIAGWAEGLAGGQRERLTQTS